MGGGGKYLILKMRHLKFKFSLPLSMMLGESPQSLCICTKRSALSQFVIRRSEKKTYCYFDQDPRILAREKKNARS